MAEFDEKLNSILSDPAAMSKIMELAQSLGGGEDTSPPQEASGPDDGAPRSSPPSGPDAATLSRLLPLVRELGEQQDSNARNLLLALRPYLKEERQGKVERAIQLARLIHIGKNFLAGWGK